MCSLKFSVLFFFFNSFVWILLRALLGNTRGKFFAVTESDGIIWVSGFLAHIKKNNMACFNLMQGARQRDTSIRSKTRRHAVLLALLILFWLHSSNTHMSRCTCMCTSTRRHTCPKFSSKSYLNERLHEWMSKWIQNTAHVS